MAENNIEGPSPRELYDLVRSKYTHEDLWTQQRIGWLLTANGFLFAGYGALLGLSSTASKAPADTDSVAILSLLLISSVGVILALFAGAGVYAAYLSKKSAIEEWNSLVAEKTRSLFPRIEATAKLKGLGSLASGGLCVFLFMAWLIILLLTFFGLNDRSLKDLISLYPPKSGAVVMSSLETNNQKGTKQRPTRALQSDG